ncbi:hypothetical protein ACLOJK_036678, partial [Asimina triloba]
VHCWSTNFGAPSSLNNCRQDPPPMTSDRPIRTIHHEASWMIIGDPAMAAPASIISLPINNGNWRCISSQSLPVDLAAIGE